MQTSANNYGYVCIIKESITNYHLFCCGETGSWQYIDTYAYAGGQTIDRVAFGFKNVSQVNPGNLIQQVDFFRYNASGQLP